MRQLLGVMVLGAVLAGCQQGVPKHAVEVAASRPGVGGLAALSEGELQRELATLARAHEQKVQLAFFVNLGMLKVGPAFKPFYAQMRTEQAELLKELQGMAKARGISLKYEFSNDQDGRALKIMEARQEKMVRADGQADFERDMLMNMYQDYEWQVSRLQALMPRVRDGALKAYVERSLKVHEAGSAASLELLRRYKFGG